MTNRSDEGKVPIKVYKDGEKYVYEVAGQRFSLGPVAFHRFIAAQILVLSPDLSEADLRNVVYPLKLALVDPIDKPDSDLQSNASK